MSVYDGTLLRILNGVTASLHLVWALIFIILWGVSKEDDGSHKDLVYPLYTSFITWTESTEAKVGYSYGECPRASSIEFGERVTVAPAWKDSGVKLSLHWLVVSFFLLSALFQMLMAVTNGFLSPPTIRFGEYSLSAAVMIVAIALQIGILHTHTLLLLATLTWATMICGLLTEKLSAVLGGRGNRIGGIGGLKGPRGIRGLNGLRTLRGIKANRASGGLKDHEDEGDEQLYNAHDGGYIDELSKRELRKIMIIAHSIGWVFITVVFGVVLNAFHQQSSCDYPQSAPKFVWAIVYVELSLFAAFGGVQLLQITDCIGTAEAEMGYVVLSFTSKTILGWLVYGGNFV